MAQNFIGCDRDQVLLLPPSLSEWLPEDHLAWFVLEAVEGLDLGAFYGAYREGGWGRAAHDRLGRRALPQRQGTVEPVFGQIKSNRGANRFLRRGRAAVRSEWQLLAATHNLRKLYQQHLAVI
jgi:Transposase DDE domain